MNINKSVRRMAVGASLAIGLVALTACGAGNGAALPKSTVSAEVGKTAAVDFVADNAKPAVFEAPGEAIDIAKFRGETIAVVTIDYSVPFVQAMLAGFKEAGAAAGVNVTIFDAKGSTDTAAKQIDQAVAFGAAAIIASALNFDLLPTAIAAANEAGVPVIGMLNIDSNASLPKGSAGEVSIDYFKSGKLLAAYAVANTDGPVHAAFQNLPSIKTFTAMKHGVEEGFTEFCSKECGLRVDDMTQADFKKAAETLTGSEIARDKKLNWIFSAIDGIAQFTIPAVEQAGKESEVRVGSINAFEANLKFIRDGRVQAVDVGNSSDWMGWAVMDRALRALVGEAPAMSTVPIKLFDAENLKGVDISSEAELYDNVAYQDEYAALWK